MKAITSAERRGGAKRILLHNRRTVGVWYELRNTPRFANGNKWLPFVDAIRNCFLSPSVEARIVLEAVRNYARAS